MEEVTANLISAKEVRELLGLSRQRVNQLRQEGKLTAVKHGIWLYDREQVAQMLKDRKAGKQPKE